ncbi:MAG: dihydrofolate reductase [Spirochaetes bacterium]|nr:dihydrofolate reductase [Spirochaetota bacterium]
MEIILIGCLASNRVIGRAGTIPWDLPEDRMRFRTLTWGKGIVMGRITFLSIGHPLEGRVNFVLSRKPDFGASGIHRCKDIPTVLNLAKELRMEELWIIGGEQVYTEFLPLADRMELTMLRQPYEGDAWFPQWRGEEWELKERNRGTRPIGDPLEHEYLRFKRIAQEKLYKQATNPF